MLSLGLQLGCGRIRAVLNRNSAQSALKRSVVKRCDSDND